MPEPIPIFPIDVVLYPNQNVPLKIFEPIKVPATASYLPLRANETEAAISGRLVPMASTV